MRAFAFGLPVVALAFVALAAGPEPKVEKPSIPAELSAAGPGADITEAFASFELVTNGFTDQAKFDADFAQFSEDAHAVAGED